MRRFATPLTILCVPAVLLALAVTARGDSLWIGSAKNPIRADGVNVLRIENHNLVFQSLAGSEVSKPLSDVQQIAADGEPAFSAAEAAFRAGNLAQATDNYLTALQNSTKPWVRERSAMRIEQDAGATHRFDAAVGAYIYLVHVDPAAAVLPSVTDATPAMVSSAADQLSKAISQTSDSSQAAALPPPQKAALLRLAIEVFQAQGNTAQVNAALEQLVSLHLATPVEQARWQLVQAQAALADNNFAQAADDINQHRAAFIDPAQQVEALYILARAADAQLTDRHDTTALKDVAIDYMRVVTFGADLAGRPHVAASLLRVGQIEEALNEPTAARDVYRQVVQGFPQDPAARTAKASLDRLGNPA